MAAHAADQVRGAAAENRPGLHAAGHADIGTRALDALAKAHALPARVTRNDVAIGTRTIVAPDIEMRAGNRHRRVGVDFDLGANQRDLERRRVRVVGDELIRQPMRERVHRTGDGHAGSLVAEPSKVLHRRQQPRLDHEQRRPASRRTLGEAARIERSHQAPTRFGGVRSASNIVVPVRPINCHPPGLSIG